MGHVLKQHLRYSAGRPAQDSPGEEANKAFKHVSKDSVRHVGNQQNDEL